GGDAGARRQAAPDRRRHRRGPDRHHRARAALALSASGYAPALAALRAQPKRVLMGRRRRVQGELAELWDLLGDFEFAVALCQSRSGMGRARPIPIESPAELPGPDLWFVTSREAEARGGIESGSIVGICCYGAAGTAVGEGGWVSLSTVAKVVD